MVVRVYINLMNDRVKKNKVRQTVEKQDSRRDVRAAADNMAILSAIASLLS